MEVRIVVPTYDRFDGGLGDKWTDGYQISATIDGNEIVIFANEEGLISLATHLLALSQKEVPSGYHLHFSEGYGLESGSNDLILGKL